MSHGNLDTASAEVMSIFDKLHKGGPSLWSRTREIRSGRRIIGCATADRNGEEKFLPNPKFNNNTVLFKIFGH
jgi:hypothetical protein